MDPNISLPTPQQPIQPLINNSIKKTNKNILLGIGLFLVFISVAIGGYYVISHFGSSLVNKSLITNSNSEIIEDKTMASVQFRVFPNKPAAFAGVNKISGHLLPPQTIEKPQEEDNIYLFKIEVMTVSGETIYYSWKDYPITKNPQNGSFPVEVIVPYEKDALVKIFDNQNNQILLTKLE